MNDFPLHQDSSCMEVQDNLEAYLADELNADLHATMATHIASCPMCQDEVRFAQAIRWRIARTSETRATAGNLQRR